MQLKKAAIQL